LLSVISDVGVGHFGLLGVREDGEFLANSCYELIPRSLALTINRAVSTGVPAVGG
jgi:hypothetical protein